VCVRVYVCMYVRAHNRKPTKTYISSFKEDKIREIECRTILLSKRNVGLRESNFFRWTEKGYTDYT
jgi:hypothetical protein